MEAASAAVAAITEAGIVPAALEFLDRAALDAIAATGAGDVAPGAGALLIVEVEGPPGEVNAHGEAVRRALTQAGARTLDHATSADEAARLWRLRKSVSAAVAKVQIGKVNEDVVVPRDRVAELVARSRRIGLDNELGVVSFGHLGDGNIHTTFLIDPRVPGDRLRAAAAAEQLFETVLSMGGSLSGEHGVGTAKLAFVERQLGAAQVALMRRLKEAFDPAGILNPGKKIPAPRRRRRPLARRAGARGGRDALSARCLLAPRRAAPGRSRSDPRAPRGRARTRPCRARRRRRRSTRSPSSSRRSRGRRARVRSRASLQPASSVSVAAWYSAIRMRSSASYSSMSSGSASSARRRFSVERIDWISSWYSSTSVLSGGSRPPRRQYSRWCSAIVGATRMAMMFITLIIGLIAGPAVSL